jgi:6-phosphogluconolactonase
MCSAARVPARTVVFVACARSDEIVRYGFDPDRDGLRPAGSVGVPGGITPLVVDPVRRVLYAGLRDQPAAVSFTIDPAGGGLSPRGRVPLDDAPMDLALDASGRFLLSASYAGSTFAINAVDGGGGIGPSIERTPTPPKAHAIRTAAANRFLFVTALGADAVLQYRFDAATGRTSANAVPQANATPGSGPRHLAVHPRGDIVYVNGELDGSVMSFALDAVSGALRPLQRSSMLPDPPPEEPWAADLALHPGGAFLFASERRSSTLASFDLRGEPGALRRIATLVTETQPRALAIDPAGAHLFAAGEISNHVTVYAIDQQTGELTARQRVATGAKPVWIACAAFPPP